MLGSSTKYPDEVTNKFFAQPSESFCDRLISFEYDHYTRTWGWWGDYEEAGSNFRADLGYYPRVGYRNVEGGLLRTWIAKPGLWWTQFRVGSEANYFDESDGTPLTRRASLWFSYSGTMQSYLNTNARKTRETYNNREFDLTYYQVEAGFWPTSTLQLAAYTIFGNQIDYANTRLGSRFRINPWLSYNLGKHLRFSFDHNYERMTVQNARLYTANISQLTAVYQFNVRTFFRTILQYVDYDYNPNNYLDSIDSQYTRFFTQWLFSYKINPRTVLFLGYSDNYRGSQDFDLTQSNRTFFIKLGYAWVL